mmetsp:Transcript_18875/g.31109  ORF Transcript_18875/g.31109 Transcript_18875/m.31109 type:complete len:410 (+) Transcript_18875:84-1313(+)
MSHNACPRDIQGPEFNEKLDAWVVQWKTQKLKLQRKCFTTLKYGNNASKTAQTFKKDLKGGIFRRGLFFDAVHGRWRVGWRAGGKPQSQYFSISKYGGYEEARNVALEFLDDINDTSDMKNGNTSNNCKLPSNVRKYRRSTCTWQRHQRRKKRQRSVAAAATDANLATLEEGMNSEGLGSEMEQILKEVGEKRIQFESACQTLLDDVKRVRDLSEQLQKDIASSRTKEHHEGLIFSQKGSNADLDVTSSTEYEYDRDGSDKNLAECRKNNHMVFSRGSIYAVNNSSNEEDNKYWIAKVNEDVTSDDILNSEVCSVAGSFFVRKVSEDGKCICYYKSNKPSRIPIHWFLVDQSGHFVQPKLNSRKQSNGGDCRGRRLEERDLIEMTQEEHIRIIRLGAILHRNFTSSVYL